MCDKCIDLQIENDMLREVIKEYEENIKAFFKLVEAWQRYLDKLRTKITEILSKKSGVPRGIWAYYRGLDWMLENVAQAILNQLAGVF